MQCKVEISSSFYIKGLRIVTTNIFFNSCLVTCLRRASIRCATLFGEINNRQLCLKGSFSQPRFNLLYIYPSPTSPLSKATSIPIKETGPSCETFLLQRPLRPNLSHMA